MTVFFLNFAPRLGRIAALFFCLAWALPAGAASLSGLSGVWAAQTNTSLKIGGSAAKKATASDKCTFTVLSSVSAALDCQGLTGAPSQHFTGAVSIVKRGNQLSWGLDQAGIDTLSATVSAALAKRNKNPAPASINVWIESQSYKPIRISEQSAPKEARGTIKGTVIQLVNANYVAKSFTYTLKIKFLGPAP